MSRVWPNVAPTCWPEILEYERELNASPKLPSDVFDNANRQYLKDHEKPRQGSLFIYGLTLVFGHKLVRRFSNFFSVLGVGEFYRAERNYPITGPNDQLASKFSPKISTICEFQSQSDKLKPCDIRYEILPPQEDRDYYSIIYHVKFPTEKMPLPIASQICHYLRKPLYGSSSDWEAIQVDVNKNTKEAIGVCYETSNYSNDPKSYNLMTPKDLHLFTQVTENLKGQWIQTVQQKNGKIDSKEVLNPFLQSSRPSFSLVSWNASFDLRENVEKNKNLKIYSCEERTPTFLDIQEFRKEGLDLRMGWLFQRRFGKFRLKLPSRKKMA